MAEKKYFTLKEFLNVVDNAYATGKATVSDEEKQLLIDHIKSSAKNWVAILDQETDTIS